MARFVDLGDDDDDQGDGSSIAEQHLRQSLHDVSLNPNPPLRGRSTGDEDAKPPTRIDNAITQAFQCYPYEMPLQT